MDADSHPLDEIEEKMALAERARAAAARRLPAEERERAKRILAAMARRERTAPSIGPFFEPDDDWAAGVRVPCHPMPSLFNGGAVVEIPEED